MPEKKEDPKGFVCTRCGKEHTFPAYVFALWRDELEHTCECGARHAIQRGVAWSLDKAEAANGEVRVASRLAGEASSAEGATSTVVLEGGR